MKKLIFLSALLGAALSMSAQTSGQVASYTANTADGGVSDAFYKHALGSISDAESKTTFENSKIEGSPYLSNIFLPTQIFYEDEGMGTVYYRYNAYNEEVEIKENNTETEKIRALGKDKKIHLIVNGQTMSFKTFVDGKNSTKNGYLTLLRDGTYKLYKKLRVSFKDSKKGENSFVQDRPAKFSQFDEYYLEVEGVNKISHVALNNKKVLELVASDKKAELKSFLKDNKLKVKSEKDLIQVVDFLNN